MNAPNSAQRKRGRPIPLLTGLLGVLLFIAAAEFFHSRSRFIHIDDLVGVSSSFKEAFFNRRFPTADEINEKLSNTTIAVSTPNDGIHTPLGNYVMYFDGQHNLFQWFDGHKTLDYGSWSIRPEFEVLTYKGKWKFAVMQIYCPWFANIDPIAQQDNCRGVGTIDDIIGIQGTKEYAAGDIFHLSEMKQPPFDLPKTAITIARLSVMMSASKAGTGARGAQ